MGMFDDLQLEDSIALPDGYTGRSFQTKDLRCEMDTYRISVSGRLELLEYDLEPEGLPAYDSFWDMERQAYRLTNERWTDQDHHGWLGFYQFIDDGWHEHRAKFTDGRLVEIQGTPAESQGDER